ncbi:prephenate dehydrogenase-like protein (plasmid) [Phaeobacter inhibens]|uniref:Prephenate dehydrogenase-like protein n=1 Tax=Phaeobacter inhibens TaxID=221822 RepID=A0ABM6RL19_9RHOB|nr:prephenate dehydrogenase/arogenate dehydrogenase family protein [Phaeobacter inhibens]AUQ52480.1 prephenate dehydrogenase-like protein [Phaeobacter inhibens]AUQ97085.1 prephenate dehydrogenase-like protein [Phaeobacter inhibens]AUR22285.1 prephenate dehydrogenase-like protein [Phaeobacter inhibens]
MKTPKMTADVPRNNLSFCIVGYGQFGQFTHKLIKRYMPGCQVMVLDAVDPGVLGWRDVAQCDVIFLAVPISDYEEVVKSLIPHVSPQTILVDIATVKLHTTEVFKRLNPSCRFLSTHPMFGPESYRKMKGNLTGFRIVVTGHNLKLADYTAVHRFIEGLGIKIVETTADAHDRDLAETLFLTHYVGQVVANAGFLRTTIDTVSFGFLMDAVDAVRNDGALFDQVVRYNPYCANVIERFDRSDREIRRKMLAQSSANRSDGMWYPY